MLEQFSRTELLIGAEGVEKLNNAKVALFGLGGVGSFVLEGLVRAGVQNFILVDNDEINLSNINRQLLATHKTINRPKVEVAKDRILAINPNANVEIHQEFFMPDSKGILDDSVSYIIDAIDTVTAKIELVLRANKLNIPIISCMGTGNKLDPTRFEIADIYKTSVCPLAKVMRKELNARGIKKLKVLYSKEEPIKVYQNQINKSAKQSVEQPENISFYNQNEETKKEPVKKQSVKQIPASISFVPSVAGLIIAGEVIKDILRI